MTKEDKQRSCNNCGKVNCENFQRQRIDCCGLWVSYKDYIKELEKENAELKRDKEDLIFVRNAKADHINELKDQLTKAKELLTKWVELFKPKGSNIPPTPIQVDTEQFLKEIEK